VAAVEAIITDFGGVLTTPLAGAFDHLARATEITLEQLGLAMAAVAARGANPLYELESGRLTEAEFGALIGAELSERAGRPVAFAGFGEALFAGMAPNDAMIGFMRSLRERGLRMAICTNNVREWSTRWRALLPVEEIFEVVVDSSQAGMRKPDPEIYELTLRELGVEAGAAVFIDDLEINVAAAAELGLHAVHFRTTEQAIADVEAALDGRA
jgi:putative hydrolase of the HAD superfamily